MRTMDHRPEPLVPLATEADFTPRMRAVAERAIQRSGRLPNSARALANAGDLGGAVRNFFEDVWDLGTLPRPLRLLIRYKVSSVNACLYCAAHQVSFLEKLGVDREKIENIHDFENHPSFDERERAALAFAESFTRDASNIPPEIASRFQAAFSPSERVEIAIVAAAMDFLNKFNDGLRVPIEDEVIDIAMKLQL